MTAAIVSLKSNRRKVANLARDYRHTAHTRLALVNLMCGVFPPLFAGHWRARLYRLIGFKIDRNVSILGNINVITGRSDLHSKLSVGENTVIASHVTINLDDQVKIGRDVAISPYVVIYTGSHRIGPGSRRCLPEVVASPVTIEDGAWIGLQATILPGVTIGRGSIVAAGSVVFGDVPPHSYTRGNPATVTRQLPWSDR